MAMMVTVMSSVVTNTAIGLGSLMSSLGLWSAARRRLLWSLGKWRILKGEPRPPRVGLRVRGRRGCLDGEEGRSQAVVVGVSFPIPRNPLLPPPPLSLYLCV